MTIRDLTVTERAHAIDATDSDVSFRMDEEAFRGFYDRTSRMLWAYLHRATGDRHAADDLLQETYFRFLRADVALDSESHRRHYLFRIATNLTRDRFRRHHTRPVLVSETEAPGVETADPLADGAFDRRIDLARAFSRLGHRERSLLWLAYAQGASHEEIAAVVGVKAGSIKALLYRARRRLAAILGQEEERA